MKKLTSLIVVLLLCVALVVPGMAEGASKIAFCFQDLETEFWVAAYDAITEELTNRGIEVLEYNGNEDANKQLEQVNDAIAQGDPVCIPNVRAQLEAAQQTGTVQAQVGGRQVTFNAQFSPRQTAILLAGGLINYTREVQKS